MNSKAIMRLSEHVAALGNFLFAWKNSKSSPPQNKRATGVNHNHVKNVVRHRHHAAFALVDSDGVKIFKSFFRLCWDAFFARFECNSFFTGMKKTPNLGKRRRG